MAMHIPIMDWLFGQVGLLELITWNPNILRKKAGIQPGGSLSALSFVKIKSPVPIFSLFCENNFVRI
jgi:hypothetical protein